MALFKNIFKKGTGEENKHEPHHHKGFHELRISSVEHLTDEAVKITFEIPENLKEIYAYVPGQYVNICVEVDGKEERRSYSICSGKNEALSIAIKAVPNGKVSKWLNNGLQTGIELQVSKPEGNFQLKPEHKNVVAISAGSGITPILSIAKELETNGGKLTLFYGSKNEKSILFKMELDTLRQTNTTHFLSQEDKEGFQNGRLSKDALSLQIKQNLDLLKADAFFICGPEEMMLAASELLMLFGVPKEKIHFELFVTPTKMPQGKVETSTFSGMSKVKVILDDESIEFNLKSDGKSILDAVSGEGYDPPYSCRGAVCCTCKAKVLKGKAVMTLNYSLTDQEVADGYVLTCQSHPASEELVISYDV